MAKNEILVEEVGGLSCEPTGGLAHLEVRVAPVGWFTSMGEPKPVCADLAADAMATYAEGVEITTDHVFNAGKGFIKLKGVYETVGLETSMIGESKRRLFENKLTLEVPGSDATLLGMIRFHKNDDLIVLATEIESGRIRQVGTLRNPGQISELSGGIEATLEGKNGFTFTFSNKSTIPAPIYKGVVTDMPAQP